MDRAMLNGSGYPDPTAFRAINEVQRERTRKQKRRRRPHETDGKEMTVYGRKSNRDRRCIRRG